MSLVPFEPVPLLKESDAWTVPVIGAITKTSPIKVDQKTIKKMKASKEREKKQWNDQEW